MSLLECSDELRETSSRTGENGGAMNVEQLLIGANQVLNNVIETVCLSIWKTKKLYLELYKISSQPSDWSFGYSIFYVLYF